MATEKSTSEKAQAGIMSSSSCYKKNKKSTVDAITVLEDVKDYINGFIHASMDHHKTCFHNTINKMFGMSKVVAAGKDRSSSETN